MSFLSSVKSKHKVSAWMGGSLMMHPFVVETMKKAEEMLAKDGKSLSPKQSQDLTTMLLKIIGESGGKED